MKKKTASVVVSTVPEVAAIEFVPAGIAKITHEFNRTDLNDLRDKINEVIDSLK